MNNNNTVNFQSPFIDNCKCKFCTNEFDFKHKYFKSYITNSKFIFIHSLDIPTTPCKINNVIYLISCVKCGIQYVGKTEQCLKDRAYGHRTGVKNGIDSNILLYKHFNTDCNKSDYRYKIIEIVQNDQNIFDRENYWIGKLMTIYPFGLNNQIKGVGIISHKNFLHNDFDNPYFNFPTVKRRPGRHGNRRHNSSNKFRNRSDINLILNNLYSLYLNFGIKNLKDSLKCLQKRSFASLLEYILYNKNNFTNKFKNIVFAFMGYIRNSSKKSKDNPIENKVISTLKYSSKILDKININSLINSKLVKSKLPDCCDDFKPLIVYSYERPVGSIICNYNVVLDNLVENDIFINNKCLCERVTDMPVDKQNSLNKFIYSPIGHILTGDVELVKHFANDKLAELCQKGFKYRIGNNKVSWNKISKDIVFSVNLLKVKLSKTVRCDQRELDDWSKLLIKLIKNKIFSLKHKFNLSDFINYNYNDLKNDLLNLHKHFIITTIDKASNNYSFTCKKFYIENIKKELGIKGNILYKNICGNSVYEIQKDLNIDHLINDHTKINLTFDIKLSDKNKCISKLYMLPKFHKRPYKYRFIAGAKFATTKTLAEQVVHCLKFIKNTHKRYCDTIKKRTGVNYYWSVDNSLEVVDKINTMNNVTSVHSFDFSTLYTNLPLDLVFSELCFIIDLHFDRFVKNGNYFINVYSFFNNASLSCTPTGSVYFDRDKLKNSIKFLLFNTYIKFGPYIFKQILGIPMGGNASPLIADLFLLALEFKFIRDLVDNSKKYNIPEKLALAKTLSNNSRYIDDILVCNILNFKHVAKSIYPNSIPLTQGNLNDYMENFLDINIQIIDDKCNLKLYHKVDDFNFNVISFPFPTSNIDNNITYNCFYSQLIRYCKICTKINDFWARARFLYRLLVDRGFVAIKLLHKFNLFKVNYCDFIIKFNINDFNQSFLT